MATPKPPVHLSRAAKAWWRQVHADFELDDHHRHLLRLACESLDQSEEARAAIAEHGAVVLDRFGCQKPSHLERKFVTLVDGSNLCRGERLWGMQV